MNRQLLPVIHELFANLSGQPVHLAPEPFTPSGVPVSVTTFMDLLVTEGFRYQLFYMPAGLSAATLASLLQKATYPVLLFKEEADQVYPVIVKRVGKLFDLYPITSSEPERQIIANLTEFLASCYTVPTVAGSEPQIPYVTCLAQVTNRPEVKAGGTPGAASEKKQPSPMSRFFSLLAPEKREIWYLYIYAAIAGIISLSLPLGVQSIIGFISAGQVTASVVVLIAVIVAGTLITGGLQLMQVWLVEYLQQRLFSRMAFDFAHRVPRFQLDGLQQYHPVELMNRFFETVTLQKGLAKILLEFSAAILQILFGLILLSFYHSSFIFFGVLLVGMLLLIIRSTGRKGVETSLVESKYKYQMVGWLQHMARALHSFKLGSSGNLGLQKTDYLVSHYITARRQHFRVLVTQYWGFIIFKTLITAALLILGCLLVVQQQINIGQFVASEIIIILIMGSVEKLILKLDVVYDVLTSLEKVATVTELPLEETQGLQLDPDVPETGLTLQVKHLHFRAGEDAQRVLSNLNFSINANEAICLAGLDAASQKAMVRVLLGMFPGYQGSITYNGLSLHDLNPTSLRRQIGWIAESEEIIPGTILENILYGQPAGSQKELMQILELVGLTSVIQNLPKGLHTALTGTPWTFSSNLYAKIILARGLLRQPRMLFIEDSRLTIEQAEKNKIYARLCQARPCTLIFLSNTETVLQLCDRVLLFSEGRLVGEGAYADLQPNLHLPEILKVSF